VPTGGAIMDFDFFDAGNEYVIYVIDTETTGLDATLNDVIEISARRFTFNNLAQQEQKTWLLRALNPATISEEALNVNKHKRSDILGLTKYGRENYGEPKEVVADFERWVMDDGVSAMDRIFAGQNPYFDVRAMQALWTKVESPDTFPFALERGNRIIDTKQLALMVDICTGKRRKFYNLSSLVKSFGAKKDRAHTAAGDVNMTTDLLIKMLSGVKSVIAEEFDQCYSD
jgi:DNA polymerase III alpha subunit (gram-positive type)